VYSIDALNAPCSTKKCTPLHVACEKGQLEVVQLLLQWGCNPFVLDHNQENVLFAVGRAPKTSAGTACAKAVLVAAAAASTTTLGTFVNGQSKKDGSTACLFQRQRSIGGCLVDERSRCNGPQPSW